MMRSILGTLVLGYIAAMVAFGVLLGYQAGKHSPQVEPDYQVTTITPISSGTSIIYCYSGGIGMSSGVRIHDNTWEWTTRP